MITDVYTWVVLMTTQTQLLITGSIISAILTLLQYRFSWSSPWRIYKWVLVTFVLIAAFNVWHVQYNITRALGQRRPVLAIVTAELEPIPRIKPDMDELTAAITVRNVGSYPANELKMRSIGISQTLADSPIADSSTEISAPLLPGVVAKMRAYNVSIFKHSPPMYVVELFTYRHPLTQALYKEQWYLRWDGSDKGNGHLKMTVVTPEEKSKIVAYLHVKGIDVSWF